MVDTDPFLRCARQCKNDKLYCTEHEAFPDLSRKLAIYAFECQQQGTEVELDEFIAWAGYPPPPVEQLRIHVIKRMNETVLGNFN